jgi:hypothetical protein
MGKSGRDRGGNGAIAAGYFRIVALFQHFNLGFLKPLIPQTSGLTHLTISFLGFGRFLVGCAREKSSNCVRP